MTIRECAEQITNRIIGCPKHGTCTSPTNELRGWRLALAQFAGNPIGNCNHKIVTHSRWNCPPMNVRAFGELYPGTALVGSILSPGYCIIPGFPRPDAKCSVHE